MTQPQHENEERRRKTVCLSMIVKDEAHVLAELVESVCRHVDAWVIVDTGSSDGTQHLVRDLFAAKGIPGELHERPWKDFGHNRSEALALCAGRGDYIWVIDADDRVHGELDLRARCATTPTLCATATSSSTGDARSSRPRSDGSTAVSCTNTPTPRRRRAARD